MSNELSEMNTLENILNPHVESAFHNLPTMDDSDDDDSDNDELDRLSAKPEKARWTDTEVMV